MTLRSEDLAELRYAKELLENPGLAARLTSVLGTPIEQGFSLLPERWADTIHSAVQVSLTRALEVAVRSLGQQRRLSERFQKWTVVGTGAAGGAFGLPALVVELPVSTTLMLRSIADIARAEGEDLRLSEGKLACLEVFALGGKSEGDDAVETGYYAVRATLAGAVAEAARHLAQRGMAAEGAPALIRFITTIASRFGIVVTEKAAAMALPAIGAVGGGLVNGLFMSHFQNMARGHFKIRKLERRYGPEEVKKAYEALGAPSAAVNI